MTATEWFRRSSVLRQRLARFSVALRFEWNEEKALANERKHAISFAEVTTLFTSGVDYLEIFDVEHSLDEERFICIGPIARGIVLVVIVDMDTDLIRIISARRATRRESLMLEQFLEERSHGG
ncbi:MAG: BrnT family toxin [Pirellulales bacterium]|jgi:uncharacterized DUF497 family protein